VNMVGSNREYEEKVVGVYYSFLGIRAAVFGAVTVSFGLDMRIADTEIPANMGL
jgi:hypothetical protein